MWKVITTAAEVVSYLNHDSGGTTAADPVSLKVELNLADTSDGLAALLSAIGNVNKYVSLDLSVCTMSDTEFDPGWAANTGRSKIVSLVLPGTATRIKAGTSNPTFENFTALKSVSGAAVQTVEGLVFSNCAALTTVSFPAATSIGGLTFASCTALTTVNLPKATSIDGHTFSNTGETALTVTLGSTAPTLRFDIFSQIEAKTVTVKIPAGAIGYGTVPATYSGSDSTSCWGNGFQGGGGSDFDFSGCGSDCINRYITLNIVYQ
ncbi:MAG: leucine-rich repeat domain-containing protein [Spirochaetaceae bacterium]|jgi:hypothetical protein|nr:leucine-rich repeat domain-containing protein [Spirochaetaceae bacterium]